MQQPLDDRLHLVRDVVLPLELAVAGVRSDLLVGGEVVLRGEGSRAAGVGGGGPCGNGCVMIACGLCGFRVRTGQQEDMT